MTTMKKDETTLEEQMRTLRRSNDVLRETYKHLRQANADLMEIIDKFIETHDRDPRQGTIPLSAKPAHWIEPAPYDMQLNTHIIAHTRQLIPYTVMEPCKCPTCETQLQKGDYAYWSGHVHQRAYCDKCIPPLGLGPGDTNYSDGTTTPTTVVFEQKEGHLIQDQAAEDAGLVCNNANVDMNCPQCSSVIKSGTRLYTKHAVAFACRKCFGT